MIPSRSGTVEDRIRHITDVLDRKVDPHDNISCKIIDVADTGSANVEFTVKHYLGRIPAVYICNIDRSGIVYDSNRSTWTDTDLTLKCSVSNAVLKLLVI